MIDDAFEIPQGTKLECDVAIIGSGAAGIPLACELIGSGRNVIQLEAGGLTLESESQDLARGEVVDPSSHGPLDRYRKRMFGGTTSAWGGRCSPFDEIDFEARDYVAESGWPITLSDLMPYYQKAHHYAFVGDFDYRCATSLACRAQETIPGLRTDVWLQDRLWRFSLPANYGVEFRQQLRAAHNVRTILHAVALKLQTNASGHRIEGIQVASVKGNRFTVKAKTVVVAAGGLESTRLLMLSDDIHRQGIGNDYGHLGRFYMSHISGDLGEVRFEPRSHPVVWQYERAKDGVYVKRHLRIREEVQRREGLLNFRCILTHPPFADADHGSAVLSAAYLAKRYFRGHIPPEFSKELTSASYHDVPRHVRNVVTGMPGLLRFGSHWFVQRTVARRKYPSVSLKSRSNTYTIHFDAEQSPNCESRVTLGAGRDRFGLRQLRVDWKCAARDIESVVRSHQLLREEIERAGAGRVMLSNDEAAAAVRGGLAVGSHHIGTTRMSDDPSRGVVDKDCEVHGVKGLFVAAPSVFPTASFANPVLTITAMSLRLADRIKSL